jgi:hypothetical protein
MAYAFRCQNCGHLEGTQHAGDNPIPGACHVCGKGVSYHFDGTIAHWVSEPDNWEILAKAPKSRLAELGLEAKEVYEHPVKAWPAIKAAPGGTHKQGQPCEGPATATIELAVEENLGAEDLSS